MVFLRSRILILTFHKPEIAFSIENVLSVQLVDVRVQLRKVIEIIDYYGTYYMMILTESEGTVFLQCNKG